MAEVSIRLALEGRRRVDSDLQSTTRSFDSLGRQASRSGGIASAALSKLSGVGSSVARTLRSTTAVVTGLGGAVVAASAGIGIKTAANMETANIAFTTMLGSGEKAQSFLADLNKFAAATPFDFPGLTQSASSLISAGIDASKVIPIMQSLGNATSGMGTGAEGIQRATVALQQMNAAQKISGEDLNQLRDAGIPVFDLLSAATGKSTQAIAEMAQTGKLGKKELDQLMGALESGKGLERFNGLMEKQSQSLSGMFSTLQDTAGMGLAGAFQPAIPFLKTVLRDSNTLLTRALPGITKGVGAVTAAIAGAYEIFVRGNFEGGWWSQLGVAEDSKVVDILFRVREAAQGAYIYLSQAAAGVEWSSVWDRLSGALTTAKNAFFAVKDAVAGVDFATLGAGLQSFGQAAGDSSVWANALKVGATLLGTALQFVSDHMDTIIKYAPLIVAAFAAWKVAQQAQIVLAITGIPLKAAEVASTFALAASNRALAAAIMAANGVQKASLATRIADFAMKVKDAAIISVMAVRYAAYAVAIGVVTAAQWVYNTAMTAGGVAVRFLLGPVGLVITAIALLAAGLVYAYKHSDTFRGIVDGLWARLKEAWNWITSTAVPVMKVVFAAALDVAKAKFEQVRDTIGGFVDKLKGAWEWVKKLADRISDSALGKAISAVTGFVGGGGGVDGHAAAGGYMRRGQTFLVGEQGPELFTAGQAGTVLSHPATVAAVNANPPNFTRSKAATQEELASLRPQQAPIHTHVILNGREIAQAVYDDAGNKMARS